MNGTGAFGAVVPVSWVFTGLLLLLIVISAAAARGSIRRNHLVGIRLPSTERSDSAWRAGHAAAVLPAGVAFGVALLGSLVGLVQPWAYAVTLAAFVGGVIWALVQASRAARAA